LAKAPSNPAAETAHPPARLTLVLPVIGRAGDIPQGLAEGLKGKDVAAVIASFANNDPREVSAFIKILAGAVQPSGAALLVTADPGLAARGGADGVHLPFEDTAIREALERSNGRMVGAGQLRSKDDAMTSGELGCDYVMFGESYDRRGEIFTPPFELVLDRTEWWSSIFEVPVVALARSLDEVGPLAEAGADFVALDAFAFAAPEGLAAVLNAATKKLREAGR
jgi:thiamine-phosphate pyrophosphorylase